MQTNVLPYFLGLPAWAFPGWKDRYFTDAPSRLASYGRVFNCVEGNTTFYSTPALGTVEQWRAAVLPPFRFSLKLPRAVTHERRPDLRELARFLDVIAALDDCLGPCLVQLPAGVDPLGIERLEPVFEAVAARHRIVLELRHPAFFSDPALAEPWLERYDAGRVMFDARPIHEGDPDHPELRLARHEKPDVPVLDTVYGEVAFVRLILHPDIPSNDRYLDFWVERTAAWIEAGYEVYMMIHCPNNQHCPPLALDFHERLRARLPMPALPGWPVPEQRGLF